MRVLSIGELWEGGTCLERARVLESSEWQVLKFDVTPFYSSGGRIRRSLQNRLLNGPDVLRFNQELLNYVATHQPFDVLWVDKGRWLFASTLNRIKQVAGAMAVHYTPDPAFTVHTSRHFVKGLHLYDLCITTKKYEIETYKKSGAKRVIFNWQGIDDRFARSKACSQLESSGRHGLVFIGHRERYYEKILAAVANVGLPLRIWGPGWNLLKRNRTALGLAVCGEGVWRDAYPATLAKGSIGIGLLSKRYPDAFTTRTFEIPAAGAMLLAERTDDHTGLFEEGKEAEFFSDVPELIDKAKYYIENESKRLEIARRGREKVLKEYTWRKVMLPTKRVVEELITKRS